MATNKTENFLRLHLLNNEAVEVLRETVLKVIRNTRKGDIDEFLKEFEADIKTNINHKQRKILFPANGRTNINEWDVSLLSFIIVNCCTLEGKIGVTELRNLMKKSISAFNTVTDFLAYHKAEIDRMRKEGEIDNEQYKKLDPTNASNLKEWDLNMLLSMLVSFSSKASKDILYDMLRKCVTREVLLHCSKPNLKEYLYQKQSECKNMMLSGKISRQEYDQLYPKHAVFPDINQWDTHLLKVFVTNVCVGLSNETLNASNTVKQIRNKMLMHRGSAEMENDDFLDTWYNLRNAIETIIKNEVPNMMQEWTTKHNKLHRGPFDITGVIDVLKDYYCKETSEFNCIEDSLLRIEKQIEAANKQRDAEYKSGQLERDILIQLCGDIGQRVQCLVDSDIRRDMYTEPIEAECIDISIQAASGNKRSIQTTEESIRLAIQNLLKGKNTEIKIKTVKTLVEEVTREGTEIVDVMSGSVLLKVKYISLKGITNLLVHTESQELQKKMEDELKTIFDVDISLGYCITEESKRTIINDLDRIKSEHKTMKPLVVGHVGSDSLLQVRVDQPEWKRP